MEAYTVGHQIKLHQIQTPHEAVWLVENCDMRFEVTTQNGKIISVKHMRHFFNGEPLDNLIAWMKNIGETKVELMTETVGDE